MLSLWAGYEGRYGFCAKNFLFFGLVDKMKGETLLSPPLRGFSVINTNYVKNLKWINDYVYI